MNKETRRFELWAGAAILAGLLLRLWFIARLPNISGDSLIYGAIAKNLLQHGVYGFGTDLAANGAHLVRPTLIRLPGYPLFLTACFRIFGIEHYHAALYFQMAADLLTCGLAAALAGQLFGRRASLLVLWISAVCPFTSNYVAAGLTETLVLATITLAFYALLRWQQAGCGYNLWLWLLVLALAYSILLRPEQGLLAAAILPAMLWSSLATPEGRIRNLRSAAPVFVAALCILLPLVPWTLRNWRTFHVIQPLAPRSADDPGEHPPFGFERWYRTWAVEFASTDQVYWNYNGDHIHIDALPTRAFAVGCTANSAIPRESQPLYADTASLLADYNRTTTSTPALEARFNSLAAQRIHAESICYYAALPVARVLNMLLRPRVEMMPVADQWWHWRQYRGQTIFAAAYAGLNLVYLLLAFAGLLAWRRSRIAPAARPIFWAMAASILLRTALLLTLDNSEPRYTLEFFPIFFVWAGALLAETSSSSERQPATVSSRTSQCT